MKEKIGYNFNDEPVVKFCYDREKKEIEVHFTGYYDLINDESIEKRCVWVIKEWEYARSRIGNEKRRDDLNDHIGIFDLILYIKYNAEDELEILVMTVDSRFPTLFLKNPKLSLIERE